jgi:hypothetical protein
MAKFMFLQYPDESKYPRPGTPELEAQIAAYTKLFEDVSAAGVLRNGDPCQPSAATFSVQVRNGETHTSDGPMHSASPWLDGYWVLDCKDRAEAIAWAAKIPAAHGGGTVEVHPIYEM